MKALFKIGSSCFDKSFKYLKSILDCLTLVALTECKILLYLPRTYLVGFETSSFKR